MRRQNGVQQSDKFDKQVHETIRHFAFPLGLGFLGSLASAPRTQLHSASHGRGNLDQSLRVTNLSYTNGGPDSVSGPSEAKRPDSPRASQQRTEFKTIKAAYESLGSSKQRGESTAKDSTNRAQAAAEATPNQATPQRPQLPQQSNEPPPVPADLIPGRFPLYDASIRAAARAAIAPVKDAVEQASRMVIVYPRREYPQIKRHYLPPEGLWAFLVKRAKRKGPHMSYDFATPHGVMPHTVVHHRAKKGYSYVRDTGSIREAQGLRFNAKDMQGPLAAVQLPLPLILDNESLTELEEHMPLFPLPTANDFIAGTVAGISITLVGHPFDTVKVRLQTQDLYSTTRRFKGGFDCALNTVRKEGPIALYKGMSGPLATVPLINAIVFASYEQGLSFFRRKERQALVDRGEWSADDRLSDVGLSLNQIALAGGWAGLVNTLIVGPVELVKSRLQLQFEAAKDKKKAKFTGPYSVIKDIVRHRGIRGLYLGSTATVVREIPAYMGQFYVYEALKRLFTAPGETTADLGPGALMTAGALAGVSAWVVSYPQDVIKSRIQVQRDDIPRQFKPSRALLNIDGGMVSCAREIWARSGIRGFIVGVGPCMGRAVPANAAGFLTYEAVARLLREDSDE